MELLDDDDALETERKNAESMKHRYKGTSNTGNGGYGSYGSDGDSGNTYGNRGNSSNSEFGGYGSGSTGPKPPSSFTNNSSTFTKPTQGGLYDDYSNKSSNLRARLGIKSTNQSEVQEEPGLDSP
jgi:hypothetical protein